jgi:hypothetical protein
MSQGEQRQFTIASKVRHLGLKSPRFLSKKAQETDHSKEKREGMRAHMWVKAKMEKESLMND